MRYRLAITVNQVFGSAIAEAELVIDDSPLDGAEPCPRLGADSLIWKWSELCPNRCARGADLNGMPSAKTTFSNLRH